MLNKSYGMKDQGLLSTYLGVQVEENEHSTRSNRQKVIESFDFGNAQPSRISMETKIRLIVVVPDMKQREKIPTNGERFQFRARRVIDVTRDLYQTGPRISVGQLIGYVQNPTHQHIGAAKIVLRYLIVTKTQGIVYSRNMEEVQQSLFTVDGCCDSDWGNDPDKRKSVTSFVHCLDGGTIS